MTIDPKERVGGCSILQIRDLLRRYSGRYFDLQMVIETLGVRKHAARVILEWLETHEFIKPVQSSSHASWRGTEKGRRLAIARASKRISRATAERLLRELLERVQQVNRTRRFAYYVQRVTVWGSYLRDDVTLGDLDVAVQLGRVEEDPELQQQRERARIIAAHAAGRHIRNMIDQVYLPQDEVMRFLKGRARSYHFVPPDDTIFQKAPQRVVFEAAGRRSR